ncbi:sodium transport atpase [Moniliophthora roreri]|nr:sodium transport atpase [Moniliophthora roreri]
MSVCSTSLIRTLVFPLRPLVILCINMITSGIKTGIFTWPVIIDCIFYGAMVGATTLCAFVVVLWARYEGNLGHVNATAEPTLMCVSPSLGHEQKAAKRL